MQFGCSNCNETQSQNLDNSIADDIQNLDNNVKNKSSTKGLTKRKKMAA
jgi:hypothetical protein